MNLTESGYMVMYQMLYICYSLIKCVSDSSYHQYVSCQTEKKVLLWPSRILISCACLVHRKLSSTVFVNYCINLADTARRC